MDSAGFTKFLHCRYFFYIHPSFSAGIKQWLHNPDICVISYINRLCSAFLNRFSGLLVPDNSLRCLL